MVYGLYAVLPVMVDVIVNLPDETEAILKVRVIIFLASFSNCVVISHISCVLTTVFWGSDFFVKFVITFNLQPVFYFFVFNTFMHLADFYYISFLTV